MNIHQTIYETGLQYSDPEKFREHHQAKAAYEDGDDNAVQGDGSYQGRTTSGGVGDLAYKTYAMKPAEEAPAQSQAPAAQPQPQQQAQGSNPLIQLSRRAAEANAGVSAFENVYLPRQGDSTIRNDKSVEQDYKNNYQAQLTQELKAKAPGELSSRQQAIQQADAQAAVNDDFGLNLAKSGMQAGQAGQRGLEFA